MKRVDFELAEELTLKEEFMQHWQINATQLAYATMTLQEISETQSDIK
jgi:hypothetical protein